MNEPTEQEIYESELQSELNKWSALNIDPAHWMPQGGLLGVCLRIDVLNDLLVDAGIIDLDVAQKKMQEITLKRLKDIREELEPQIQAAKIAALRANGMVIPHMKPPREH